jgi:hypothetical protein
MANSQNGWPVATRDDMFNGEVLGVKFPNGFLKGDVEVIFKWLIVALDTTVESIIDGSCWGWFVKVIEGGTSISNHASGTAIDYNASKHPMGVHNTYSAGDRERIHAILNWLEGVVRWGGDYAGRPDDMHFEIHGTRAQVKRVADKIRSTQMATWTDTVNVTETTGKELYEPDLAEGTPVPAASLLQLSAIWARRATIAAESNGVMLKAILEKLG